MSEGEDEDKVRAFAPVTSAAANDLPYTVELWDMSRAAPERVIGQAASMVLAQAIFTAAKTEHLGRRLVLRRGAKVIQESD